MSLNNNNAIPYPGYLNERITVNKKKKKKKKKNGPLKKLFDNLKFFFEFCYEFVHSLLEKTNSIPLCCSHC